MTLPFNTAAPLTTVITQTPLFIAVEWLDVAGWGGGGVSGVVNWTGAVGNIYGGSGSRLVSFDNPVMARSTPILDPHFHQVEQCLGRFVQSIR